MKLFGQLVRTAVNLAAVPVAVAKDLVMLGGTCLGKDKSSTSEALDKLKEEAREELMPKSRTIQR